MVHDLANTIPGEGPFPCLQKDGILLNPHVVERELGSLHLLMRTLIPSKRPNVHDLI